MERTLKIASKDLSLLVHDIERYYKDHIFTMELMWPKETLGEAAEIFGGRLNLVPRGVDFKGAVIPSIDKGALYVRVQNGLMSPGGRPMNVLAHRIPLEDVPESLMDLVFKGVFTRIAWAFLKKIWAEIDAKTTHYELSRDELPGLLRRARLKSLLEFVNELVLMEVAPFLKAYFHGPEIGALFVERLTGSLLQAEHPDELKGLGDLREGLAESFHLAEKVDLHGGICLEG